MCWCRLSLIVFALVLFVSSSRCVVVGSIVARILLNTFGLNEKDASRFEVSLRWLRIHFTRPSTSLYHPSSHFAASVWEGNQLVFVSLNCIGSVSDNVNNKGSLIYDTTNCPYWLLISFALKRSLCLRFRCPSANNDFVIFLSLMLDDDRRSLSLFIGLIQPDSSVIIGRSAFWVCSPRQWQWCCVF